MTTNDYNIQMCLDKENRQFDWDLYQHLCDIDVENNYEPTMSCPDDYYED